MAIQQLHNGNPDGALFGQATTDKLGFYGLTTPIVQPSVTAVVTTATTATNEAAVTRLYTALVNLGLIVTS
jgi:hypothetical protein